MSHYKFRRAIILVKIAPDEYSAKNHQHSIAFQRNDKRSVSRMNSSKRSSSSVASASTQGSTKKQLRSEFATVTRLDSSVSPFNNRRLDFANYMHLPEPSIRSVGSGLFCSLCQWSTGKKSQLLKCLDCNVILCSWCYQTFHVAPRLDDSTKIKHELDILKRVRDTKEKSKSMSRSSGRK